MTVYAYITISLVALAIILYILRERSLDRRWSTFLSWMSEFSRNRTPSQTEEDFPNIVLDLKLINDIFLSKDLPVDISTLLVQLVEQVRNSQLPPKSIAIVRSARIDGTDVKFGFDILSIGEIKDGD